MMPAEKTYGDELSEAEEKLGFELLEVKNPHGEFFNHPPTVTAVIFRKGMGPSDRIIKMRMPGGGSSYKHQRFGHFGNITGLPDEWLPVGSVSYPNPEMAIRSVTSGQAERTEQLPVRITPVDPGENY